MPGQNAFRTAPGKAISPTKASIAIGDVTAATDVQPGAKEVVFNLKLPAGKTRMTALFTTADGEEFGAYYAYVRLKP